MKKIFKLIQNEVYGIGEMLKRLYFLMCSKNAFVNEAMKHEPHGAEQQTRNSTDKLRVKIFRAFFHTGLVFFFSYISYHTCLNYK